MVIAEDLTLDFAAKQWLTQLPLDESKHRADFPASIIRKNAHSFAAGTALTFEGDDVATVLCVLKGWLSLSKSLSDGQTQIIDFVLSGDIVSPVSADGHTSSLQVEAVTDVVVAILTEAEWARLKHEWPAIEAVSTHLAAAHQSRIAERMLRLGRGSAPNRIAYSLLELCVRLRSIGRVDRPNLPPAADPATAWRIFGAIVGSRVQNAAAHGAQRHHCDGGPHGHPYQRSGRACGDGRDRPRTTGQ